MKSRNRGKVESQADIESALDELCAADPRLCRVRLHAGEVPLRRSSPGFSSLAGIIVAQQVSKASADAIHARLLALIEPLTPDALLKAEESLFRQAGLSRPKQRTLLAAAEAIAGGRLDLAGLCDADAGSACAQMVAIPGIGPWTAECYLLFAAGHADIFPAGDLALQAAVAHAFTLENRPSSRELALMAEQWAPWRAVAARLFWAYYREIRGREAVPPVAAQDSPE